MQRAAATAALAEAMRQGGSPSGPLFRRLVEGASDMVILTDASLDWPGPYIRYVNPAFTRVTGWAAEEVLGRSPRLLQGPGTDRQVLAAMGASLRAGSPASARLLNHTRNGMPFWLDMQVVPMLDPRGRIGVFASFARNVTGQGPDGSAPDTMADCDLLTGLPGRQALLRVSALEFAAQPSARFCFAVLGVDGLAAVRAEHGPRSADAVLMGVAGLLARNLRRVDLVGRLDDARFGLCMPGLALVEARTVVQRLRAAVAASAFPTPAGPLRVSCGGGLASALAGDQVAQVVARAEAALEETSLENQDLLAPA
ncbi:sensor domain-containing diguanylate cyclase [Muricoccus vinaceus]|uniref:Diguanylate cyclase domain-containing protein n=1 Tax=Muricoccus vinaceus TaxID=424704 RepID=A0ABV6ING7_9PROT